MGELLKHVPWFLLELGDITQEMNNYAKEEWNGVKKIGFGYTGRSGQITACS